MNPALRAILLSPFDSDARAWRASVAANGGTVNTATMRAVHVFCRRTKAENLWDKLTRINLVCGDQLAAAQVPLKVGGGSATETFSNIVAGDYVETGATAGIKGNGTNKSFSTGFNPTGSSVSSFGLWAYVKGTEAAGTSCLIMGVQNGAASITSLGWTSAGTSETGNIAGSTTEYAPSGNPPSKEGFLGIVANGSRANQYYQNGAAVSTAVTATGAHHSAAIEVLATNNAGTLGNWSTRYLRSYAITTGMSAAEVAVFNTIMRQFQSALGRNV